jgi:hypothetical protein
LVAGVVCIKDILLPSSGGGASSTATTANTGTATTGSTTTSSTNPTPGPTATPTSEPSGAAATTTTTTNSPSLTPSNPDHTVLTQKPKSSIPLASLRSPSSQLQSGSRETPDSLFKGPSSVPGGSVPLSNPALVPAPNEEAKQGSYNQHQCITTCAPFPISQDEICRNGTDDDHDGKVDEVPCSEVPGESKPRPSDGTLTPTPGQPLGP